jgi:large subunit ribosomal protein L21
MRAIIETGGLQFPVENQSVIKVPKLKAEVGGKVDFDKVLLISGVEQFSLGNPYIAGAKVSAEVVGHGRDPKVIVFKFKKRRKYRRTHGHRQAFTTVKILGISA